MGASGQPKKTNGETRCVKIAWYSGILYWHIEVVVARVDVVCAAVLKTYGFTLGFNSLFDNTLPKLGFNSLFDNTLQKPTFK